MKTVGHRKLQFYRYMALYFKSCACRRNTR